MYKYTGFHVVPILKPKETHDFVFVIRLLLRYNTESIFKDRKFSKSQNEFSKTKLTAVFMTCYCLATL